MDIIPFLSPLTLTNTYIITQNGRDAVIIDPTCSDMHLINVIEEKKLKVKAYLITQNLKSHKHGLGVMEKIYPALIFAPDMINSKSDVIRVKGGDKITIADMEFEAISIKGILPAVNVYKTENVLFTGETLLSGSVGITTNPSSRELLLKEIREKLLTMKENTLVFPSRGPVTKIRIEKMFNGDLLESQADYI